uniref:Receptor expression-enhancing protein n=1 Tax=Meloidogyne floridensis TaxID=298350 RepID=A0A915P050_9BILA
MSAPPPPEPPKKDDAPPPPAAPPAPPPATAKAPSEASTKKKGKSAGSLPPPSASPSGAAIGLRQVEVQSFSDIRPALQKWLDGQDKLFGAAEKSSGLEREKIFYAICGFLFLWLLAAPGAGLICNLIGVAYPAYASVVALRSAGKGRHAVARVLDYLWNLLSCGSIRRPHHSLLSAVLAAQSALPSLLVFASNLWSAEYVRQTSGGNVEVCSMRLDVDGGCKKRKEGE